MIRSNMMLKSRIPNHAVHILQYCVQPTQPTKLVTAVPARQVGWEAGDIVHPNQVQLSGQRAVLRQVKVVFGSDYSNFSPLEHFNTSAVNVSDPKN